MTALLVVAAIAPSSSQARAGYRFVGTPVLQAVPALNPGQPSVTGGPHGQPAQSIGVVFRLNRAIPRYKSGSYDAGMKVDGQFSSSIINTADDYQTSPRRNCYVDSDVIPRRLARVGRKLTLSYLIGDGHDSYGMVRDPRPLEAGLVLHSDSTGSIKRDLRRLGCF
jgi:hypothetical protein